MKQRRDEEPELTLTEQAALRRAQSFSLLGLVIPAGEFLLPYLFLRKELTPATAKSLAFQQSWLVYRWAVIALTASVVISTAPDQKAENPASDIAIVAEPTDAKETPARPPLTGRERLKEANEQREFIAQNRQLFVEALYKKPETATFILQMSVGMGVCAVLWLTSVIYSLFSLVTIHNRRWPSFPLTISYFQRRLLAKKRAGD